MFLLIISLIIIAFITFRSFSRWRRELIIERNKCYWGVVKDKVKNGEIKTDELSPDVQAKIKSFDKYFNYAKLLNEHDLEMFSAIKYYPGVGSRSDDMKDYDEKFNHV